MILPPPKVRELIRKLHAMLGSPSDKEALSARKKLSRLLAKHELSWNDLPAILAGINASNSRANAAPSGGPVDPPKFNVLDLVLRLIEEHIAITAEERMAVALWLLHTWVFGRFRITPRLALLSPVRGCGKTSFLNLLAQLVLEWERCDDVTAASRRGSRRGSLASRGQQVVDIGSDPRWIRIPFALPVAVYLPIWTRKFAIVGPTPLANCVVRSAQAAIRSKVRGPCHRASGRRGTDDLALLGKRSIKLHPDFQANSAVPIDCDVATGSCLLRTHCVPDQPAALRHDTRKLGRACLASDDSEGDTIEFVEPDCRGRQWTLPR